MKVQLFLIYALSSFVEARSRERERTSERGGRGETLKGGVIHFLSPLHLIGIYSGSVLNGQSQREGVAHDLGDAFSEALALKGVLLFWVSQSKSVFRQRETDTRTQALQTEVALPVS